MNTHIAVDIGGTQLRAATYAEDSLKPLQIIRAESGAVVETILRRMPDYVTHIVISITTDPGLPLGPGS